MHRLVGRHRQLALDNPDLGFFIPETGGTRWSDTMIIPTGASNVDNAASWMDFVYDPVNGARITACIGYTQPGVGRAGRAAQDWAVTLRRWPTARSSSPTRPPLARLQVFGTLDEEEEQQFDERFAEITGA